MKTPAGKQAAQDAIARQWVMLRRIPRAPRKISASMLADALESEGHHVSKRTIERDLLALQAIFPLVCDDRSRPFGWSWAVNAPLLDLPGLTPAEALSFQMVHRYLEPLLPSSILDALKPHFVNAEKVLGAEGSGVSAGAWANKVRIVHPSQLTQAPEIDRSTYGAITEALLSGRQIDVRYGGQKKKDLTLHPLALVQRGPVTYVVATAFGYGDVRLYAAHRVSSAKVLEAKARQITFDIDRWIADGALGFGRGTQIRLVALFAPEAAAHLTETRLAGDQKLTTEMDGRVRVTATIADTPQLLWWLRGFGDDVEVLQPKALRESMADSAAAALALYRK